MGSRKRETARKRKEQKSDDLLIVKLNKNNIAPRKMRLVANQIKNLNVKEAINVLRFSKKVAAQSLEKLILSAIANWGQKNKDKNVENFDIKVKEVRVDGGTISKRIRPAPQGRAHRIRKRSNHVTLVLNVNSIESND